MGLSTLTPPPVTSLVVSTAELAAYLRLPLLPSDPNDFLLYNLLREAQEYLERETEQQLFTATKLQTLDFFPGGNCMGDWAGEWPYGQSSPVAPNMMAQRPFSREIRLRTPPLQSVTSVTYVYQGQTLTLSPSLYTVDAVGLPGRIVLNGGQVWPATDIVANAVQITYVCGYGASPSSIPTSFKTAVRWFANHLYENREAATANNLKELPIGLQSLIESLMFREATGA